MQAASLTVVAVLLFAIAIDRRSPVLFGCSGVVTGIAFQTYYAAWLTPLILGAWAVARLLSDREQGKTAIKGFVVTMVLFIVTLAPLLAHYVQRPDGVTSRTRQVFLFSEKNREHVEASYGTSDPTKLLAMNAVRFGRFLVGNVGDGSVQYGLQGQFFDPFLLPFILAGLAYALTLIRQPGGQLLWIWFLGTMIAGGLLTIDAVFSPRLIGITAIILLFPGPPDRPSLESPLDCRRRVGEDGRDPGPWAQSSSAPPGGTSKRPLSATRKKAASDIEITSSALPPISAT